MEKSSTFSKADHLKDLLLEDIRIGVYKPGDRIPSVRDLCRKYQVSKQTVARAISNLNELQVLELAHGKVTRIRNFPSRKRIELIFFGYGNLERQDFWSEFYRGIFDEALKEPDYYLHISGFSSKNLNLFLNDFRREQLAGALILGTSNPVSLGALHRFPIPMLSVHDFNYATGIDAVTVDMNEPLNEALDLFREQQRRQVAFFYAGENVAPGDDCGINRVKRQDICRALLENGLMPDESFIRKMEYTEDAGYRLLMQMAQEKRLPDGIVLFSDVMAPSVLRAAYELKIELPRQMSLLGLDNLGCGRFTIPSLTTIDFRRYEQGRLAFRRLVEAIESGEAPRGEILKADLIRRESL